MSGGAALASGAAIAWSNALAPRLARRFGWGSDGRSAATLAFCLADSGLARSSIPTVPGAVAGVALAVAGLATVEPVDRQPPSSLAKWVLVDIPLGTTLPEELLFRGVLTPALRRAYGARTGSIAGPAVFGLWHVGAARAAHDPVFPTICVTFLAGAGFDVLTRRTGRWWPAFVAHWLLNGCGAVLSSGSVFSSSDATAP
ncbi:hypothetical protein MTP03_24990 [Tsukamurella sp. PLM1]|nr:hypothetical protein MTP03_24990 [Tsukamurella sp. PLM1]